MKTMKKTMAIVLSVLMVLAMSLMASAIGTDGKITVTNATAGQTYDIYQIFDLQSYDADANHYSYTVTEAWAAFVATQTDFVTVDKDGFIEIVEGADAAAFAKAAIAYAQAEATKIAPTASQEATGETVEFTGLSLGYYLVDSTTGTLCSLDTTNPEVEIEDKNPAPSIDKDIVEGDTTTKENDVNIGDTVNYKITVTLQPGAENYVLHDVLSDGLTLNGDVTASIDAANYVVTTEDQTPGDGKTWRTPDMGDDEIWKHPVWMRVELPEGATDVYFARGKSLEKYDKESYLKGLHEGYPYNKTVTYSASDFGTNNVYTPTNWGAVHWYYCSTAGCEFGTKEHKITDGKWSFKTVEELAEELSMPELAEGYSFATVVMEPTDDDTSLSSLIINKTPVSISHRVVYTLPSILENENNTVIVEAQPNYKDASVVVDPISYNLANGESKEFKVLVTSKNERNKEEYTVKVKRAPAPHVNPGPIKPSEKGICYILDNEEKVVTFVFEYDQWGYTKWNKEKIIAGTETHRVLLRGSFTRKYNESKGSWGEDTNTYVMTYDKNNDWYFTRRRSY